MSSIPPARLSDRPLHSRSFSSMSSLSPPSSINAASNTSSSNHLTKASDEGPLNRSTLTQNNVKWGIAWHPPTLMLIYALGGTSLAIGHHLYFSSLHGTQAGSSARQQWATGFGTAISFLVVALLRAAICAAYGQYVWTIVRRKSFCISTLDKLFALTTDPTGFFGFEMLKHAKIAMVAALIAWITPLAGIAPPATLSVVTGLVIESNPTMMASLDWNSPAFYDVQPDFSLPSSDVVGIATQSALSMDIIPLTPPAPNSSFSLQFYGPSVSCSPANSTQQNILDYYTEVNRQQRSFMTESSLQKDLRNASQFESRFPPSIASYNMLVFSAFAPYSGIQGWLWGISRTDEVDQFNNWDVDLPWETDELGWTVDQALYDDVVQQLFVQTSTNGYVCLMGNASYNVDFEFVNGAQSRVRYATSDFVPVVMMRSGDGAGGGAMQNAILPGPYTRKDHTRFELSYMAVWQSFASLISGNITFSYVPLDRLDNQGEDFNLTLKDISSRILLNGLSGCDEIIHSYWDNIPVTLKDPRELPTTFYNSSALAKLNVSNEYFHQPASICRNRTLIRAIEDLAGNITIGMLSSSSLTYQNSTLVNVTYQTTKNIYQYDSRNLIISYATAVVLTILGAALGVFALIDNGVVHSNAFSAVVATTRNSELDELSQGHSLGAIPLDKGVAKVKLRFGGLVAGSEKRSWRDSGATHIGFGFESAVVSLRNGGNYV